MICSKLFGMFTYKYHCIACGNVVCSDCSKVQAIISELASYGPQKVCHSCFFGQEIVEATKYLPEFREKSKHLINLNMSDSISSNTSMTSQDNGSSNYSFNDFPRDSKLECTVESKVDTKEDTKSNDIYTNPTVNHKYIEIIPKPEFVMKIKRLTNLSKIFINICSHERVPYMLDNSLDRGSFEKNLYLVGGNKRNGVDKNGQVNDFTIYDIIINPNESLAINLDVTTERRKKLCLQVLKFIRVNYNEPIDDKYVCLELLSNYKFSDNRLIVSTSLVPEDCDVYKTNRQYLVSENITNKPDRLSVDKLSIQPVDEVNHNNNNVININQTIEKPNVFTTEPSIRTEKNTSKSSFNGKLTNTNTNPSIYWYPLDEIHPTDYNFCTVKSANSHDYKAEYLCNVDEIIIYPFAGYVIECNKSKLIYINVTHHTNAGLYLPAQKFPITKNSLIFFKQFIDISKYCKDRYDQSDLVGEYDILKFISENIIIGKYTENAMSIDQTITSRNSILDLCISTYLYQLMNSDKNLHYKISLMMVEYIANYCNYLSIKFDINSIRILTNLQHNYIPHIQDDQIIINDIQSFNPCCLFNFPEFYRNKAALYTVGELSKRGNNFQTWKARRIEMIGPLLRYLDRDIYKGEINLCPHLNISIKLKNTDLPPNCTSCFTVTTNLSNELLTHTFTRESNEESKTLDKVEKYFASKTEDEMNSWIDTLICQSTYMNRLLNIVRLKPLPPKEGYLYKSSRKRYFILSDGILYYYLKEGPHTNQINQTNCAITNFLLGLGNRNSLNGIHRKGYIVLHNAIIRSTAVNEESGRNENRFRLTCTEIKEKDYFIDAESASKAKEWMECIALHIKFANTYPYLLFIHKK